MKTIAPFLIALATAKLALAQLPAPHLRSIHPVGAQTGTTVEVVIAGTELDEASGLLFSHPGIKAEPVILPATEFRPAHPDPFRFRVTVGNEVPAGEYDVHTITRLGLSGSRPFLIGHSPEIPEPGTNKEASRAFEIPLGSVVNARADGDSIDYFRFKAKAGQPLLVQCQAERIGSKMDATLAIYDASGRKLLSDRDTLGRDPVLSFTPPADGDYFLHVYDFLFRGGDELYYRLTVSEAPHLDFIVPPAGKPGRKSKFTIYGRNLPGGSKGEGVRLGSRELESVEVEIQLPQESQSPASFTKLRQALLPGFDYRLKGNDNPSNPIRLGLTTEPMVEETEANADQAIQIPVEVHGRFHTHGDLDRFLIEARKGSPLWVECLADRMGAPCDPLLIIERQTLDDKGNKTFTELQSSDDGGNPGGRQFPVATRDPALSFSPPEDGTYRITLLNQSGRGGPASQYRLIVREPKPDFDLIATPLKPHRESKILQPVPALLRQGGTCAYQVLALRNEGFAGEIIVEAGDLPKGVTCLPVRILPGQNQAVIVLQGTGEAPDWNGFITLTGRSGDLTRTARTGLLSWGVNNYETERLRPRLASGLPLSVCASEMAPVFITHPNKAEWVVQLGSKLDIPVKLFKQGGRKGDFTIQPEGQLFTKNAPQLKLKETDSEGTLSIEFKPSPNFPVKPGLWQFPLHGDGLVRYRNNPAAADRAEADRKRLTDLKSHLEKQAKEARAAVAPAQKALNKALEDLQSASPEAKPQLQASVDQARSHLQAKEQAAREAEAKAKRAENERLAAENRAKAARERAKEKDVKISTYSLPVTVRVIAPEPKEESK